MALPILRVLAVAGVAGIAAGCTNPYEAAYRPIGASQINGVQQFSGEPRLERSATADGQTEINRLYQQGYGLIGVSGFVGEARNEALAIDQAKKVHAAVVVLRRKYRNTATKSTSLPVPTITTVDSYGTVSGSGGSGTYSGTSTVYGTRSEQVTSSIDQYDQIALFFVPLQRMGAGILLLNMTDEQKRVAETNQGVAISAVRNGSPAYAADIVPGDILIAIDSYKVFDRESSIMALTSTRGRAAAYVLLRNGRRIEKTLAVPTGTW